MTHEQIAECLADNLDLTPEDFELTREDSLRLRDIRPGDELGNYAGFIAVQRLLLAEEKAAQREKLIHDIDSHLAQVAFTGTSR